MTNPRRDTTIPIIRRACDLSASELLLLERLADYTFAPRDTIVMYICKAPATSKEQVREPDRKVL